MTETQERSYAEQIYKCAVALAEIASKPQDLNAATAAILCRAFELATPDLDAVNRARIFWGEA